MSAASMSRLTTGAYLRVAISRKSVEIEYGYQVLIINVWLIIHYRLKQFRHTQKETKVDSYKLSKKF